MSREKDRNGDVEALGQGPEARDFNTRLSIVELPVMIGNSDATVHVGAGGNTVLGTPFEEYAEDLVRERTRRYDQQVRLLRTVYTTSEPGGLDLTGMLACALPVRVTDEQLETMNIRAGVLWEELSHTLTSARNANMRPGATCADYIPINPTLLPASYGLDPVTALRGTAAVIHDHVRSALSTPKGADDQQKGGAGASPSKPSSSSDTSTALQAEMVWWPGVARVGLGHSCKDFVLRRFVRVRPLTRTPGAGFCWSNAWRMNTLPSHLNTYATAQVLQPMVVVGDVAMSASAISVNVAGQAAMFDARSGGNYIKTWASYMAASTAAMNMPSDIRAMMIDFPATMTLSPTPMPIYVGGTRTPLTRPYIIPGRADRPKQRRWGPRGETGGTGRVTQSRSLGDASQARPPSARDEEDFDDEG